MLKSKTPVKSEDLQETNHIKPVNAVKHLEDGSRVWVMDADEWIAPVTYRVSGVDYRGFLHVDPKPSQESLIGFLNDMMPENRVPGDEIDSIEISTPANISGCIKFMGQQFLGFSGVRWGKQEIEAGVRPDPALVEQQKNKFLTGRKQMLVAFFKETFGQLMLPLEAEESDFLDEVNEVEFGIRAWDPVNKKIVTLYRKALLTEDSQADRQEFKRAIRIKKKGRARVDVVHYRQVITVFERMIESMPGCWLKSGEECGIGNSDDWKPLVWPNHAHHILETHLDEAAVKN